MSLGITKDCFPPATECHNCLMKVSSHVKKKPTDVKDFKRCGSCHLLNYCDTDCQRDHWIKVHKHHCRFLSGKVQVKNNEHDAATCALCIEERESSSTQLRSANSPKTSCNIEKDAIAMKKMLGRLFGFHDEEKKGHCSLEFPCELPFPLGEVSDQYVEKDTAGLDIMLAHALKIINVMFIKAQEKDDRIALNKSWNSIIFIRSELWYSILISGIPRIMSSKHLSEQVANLTTIYRPSNPWWKSLKFTVDFVVRTDLSLDSNSYDFHSLEDVRFQKMKLLQDYRQSQLQNQAKVSKEMWPNFLLWPKFANGFLSLLLPPSTRCHSCHDELGGEVAVTPQEANAKSLPLLILYAGENGALLACCATTKNPNCWKDCASKNVEVCMQSDEDKWKEFVKEYEIFAIESRDCDLCLKSSLSSHRCSACRSVQYCSTVCQKKDLKFHKTVCATWAKDKSRRIKDKDGQMDHWKSFVAEQKETL